MWARLGFALKPLRGISHSCVQTACLARFQSVMSSQQHKKSSHALDPETPLFSLARAKTPTSVPDQMFVRNSVEDGSNEPTLTAPTDPFLIGLQNRIHSVLATENGKVQAHDLKNLIAQCMNLKQWELVITIWNYIRANKKMVPVDPKFVVQVMEAYNALERFDEVDSMLTQLREEGFIPSLRAYNVLLSTCLKSKDLDRAEKYYAQLIRDDLRPNKYTYREMVKLFKQFPDSYERAHKLVHEIQIARLDPTVSDVMVHICLALGRYGEAASFFMESYKVKKTTFATHVKMISVFARSRHYEIAEQLFRYTPKRGWPLTLDMYDMILDIYAEQKELEKAQALFDEMLCQGHVPTIKSFNCLLACYLSVGDQATVSRIRTMMENVGVEPNGHSYGLFIASAIQQHKYEHAVTLFQDMRSRRIRATEIAANCVITALFKLNRFHDCALVFTQMESRGIAVQDRTLYRMVKAYTLLDKFVTAERLFFRLSEKGMSADVFNAAITLYGRIGDAQKAAEYFNQMIDRGLPPTKWTFLNMIDMYDQLGMATKADEMTSLMNLHGFCDYKRPNNRDRSGFT